MGSSCARMSAGGVIDLAREIRLTLPQPPLVSFSTYPQSPCAPAPRPHFALNPPTTHIGILFLPPTHSSYSILISCSLHMFISITCTSINHIQIIHVFMYKRYVYYTNMSILFTRILSQCSFNFYTHIYKCNTCNNVSKNNHV